MGRPTNQYFLTPAADDLFPKNYHHLTLDLLGELMDESGEERVTQLFDRRKDRLLRKYESYMQGKSLEERVEQLADIQNAGGYMVNWMTDDEGNIQFQEFNCPIAQVANEYNHACQCELALFQELLQAPVERTECLAKGGSKCNYKIQTNKEAR
jgi:predicted ArsR family transcriptional regulator